ncbi:hypothetical protein [Natrinema marinum]|nr:hypothetical protein [Natrinema marinum]
MNTTVLPNAAIDRCRPVDATPAALEPTAPDSLRAVSVLGVETATVTVDG